MSYDDRKERRPLPVRCPQCSYLTGTPSGYCPRCGQEIPSHACWNCGYDLRGNTTGSCPECGKPWELPPVPPGYYRCTHSDCVYANPTGSLTCRGCGRAIPGSDVLSEPDMKFIRDVNRYLTPLTVIEVIFLLLVLLGLLICYIRK